MSPSSSSHTRLRQDEVDCSGSDVRAGRRTICACDELFQVRVTLDCRGSQVLTAYSSCSMNTARYFARHLRHIRPLDDVELLLLQLHAGLRSRTTKIFTISCRTKHSVRPAGVFVNDP